MLAQEDLLQAIAKTGHHVMDETKVCISLVCTSTARVGSPALASLFGAAWLIFVAVLLMSLVVYGLCPQYSLIQLTY